MELLLTRPTATASQVTVTCDGQVSHTFDLSALIPTKANGLSHPITDPVGYGAVLYQALFPPDSLAHKTLAGKPKRILLVAADEVLDAIPWEYLHGPDGFVVCDVPFVRGLPKEQRIPAPERMGSLYIVAVPSNPLHPRLAPLNIEGEWMRLRDVVQGANAAVILERVWPPTIERLRDLVTGEPARVVHFMGHGGQNAQGEAVLYFERESGAPEEITARELIQRVRNSAFLVTLNACEGATPEETSFGNLAMALVRQHIPYALGMRSKVPDDIAPVFTRAFYRYLVRGDSIEESLRQARLTLAKDARAWVIGVPVLYTSLSQPAPGFATPPGIPQVRDPQEDALRGIIGILPTVQGVFQGRRDELLTLGKWLTGDHRPRMMTIHGSGGQGKTALARVASERFAHAWSGGVWAITLEAVPTRAVFVAGLARFLGINPQENAGAAYLEKQVLLRLRRRRMLLVLDNMETLDEAVKVQDADALALAAFIQQLPGDGTSLLCTSRHQLGWSGECHLELLGLAPGEGAALFLQSASTRIEEIVPSQARQLSQQIDGHALGLVLLGKAFTHSSLSFQDFLADHEHFLLSAENIYAFPDHRQRTLYANFAYSVKWLSPEQRETLSKLWVFHAPFLSEIAVAILEPEHDATTDRSPVEDHLDALWQRGLLTRDVLSVQSEDVGLYRVPPVLRPFLEQDAAQESERAALLARYGRAYAHLVHRIVTEMKRSQKMVTLALLCREDLERGQDYVADEERGYYVWRWGWVLHRLGDRTRGLALMEQVIEMAQGSDQTLMIEAMNNQALVYQATGQLRQALHLHEQTLLLFHEMGDHAGEAEAYNNLGSTYNASGQRQQALDSYQQALLLFRMIEDRMGEAATLNNLGLVYTDMGQWQQAIEQYQQALPILREVGHRAGEAATLSNLGLLYDLMGQKQQAIEQYQQALLIVREVGDRATEATVLNNLGRTYSTMGQLSEALDYYQQALPMLDEITDRAGLVTTLNNIGALYAKLEQHDQALDYYQDAVSLAREVGDSAGEATVLYNLGRVSRAMEQQDLALDYYRQALSLKREVGDLTGEANTLHNIGMIYASQGRSDVALACILQAKTLYEELQHSFDVEEEEQWIASLRAQVGEQQFVLLLAQVEPQVETVVEQALATLRNEVATRGGLADNEEEASLSPSAGQREPPMETPPAASADRLASEPHSLSYEMPDTE